MTEPTHYRRKDGEVVSVNRQAWKLVMLAVGLTTRKQLRKRRKAETKARMLALESPHATPCGENT